MALETVTEQFSKYGQQAFDNYWQAVEQISDTTENLTGTFLYAVPAFSGDNSEWLNTWKGYRKRGMTDLKHIMNSFTNSDLNFDNPQEYTQRALEVYRENLDRWFEQVEQFQTKSREAIEKMVENVPEPQRQWVDKVNKITNKGVETLKSAIQENIELAVRWSSAQKEKTNLKNQAPKATGKSEAKAS